MKCWQPHIDLPLPPQLTAETQDPAKRRLQEAPGCKCQTALRGCGTPRPILGLSSERKRNSTSPNLRFTCSAYVNLLYGRNVVVKCVPDSVLKQHASRAGLGSGPSQGLFLLTSELNWDLESAWAPPPSSLPPPGIPRGTGFVLGLCFGGSGRESGAAFFFLSFFP